MIFLGLTACLTLVAYGAAMLLGTPLTLLLYGATIGTADPGTRSRRLFAARLLPAALGLFVALGFVLPAFVLLEPKGASERVGPVLAFLALALGAVVLAGVLRGASALLATWRVVRGWSRHARPIRLAGISLPTFLVEDRFPLVAVVASFPPRLYVARTVLENCTRAELDAIVAHESGHVRHGDPWRVLLLRVCPDFLALLPFGRSVERRWAEAAEEAADDHASALSPARSLDLASALIRVARLAGSATREELPLTALYRGGGVASRVARILDRPAATVPPRGEHRRPVFPWIVAAGLAVSAAASFGMLQQVHRLLEAVVSYLS